MYFLVNNIFIHLFLDIIRETNSELQIKMEPKTVCHLNGHRIRFNRMDSLKVTGCLYVCMYWKISQSYVLISITMKLLMGPIYDILPSIKESLLYSKVRSHKRVDQFSKKQDIGSRYGFKLFCERKRKKKKHVDKTFSWSIICS